MRSALIAALLITTSASSADAQRAITGRLTVESFDGYTGAGLAAAPAAGQLDSDEWRITGMSDGTCGFGGACAGADFARGPSSGGENTGGLYAFSTTAGDPTFGYQAAANDMTPGTITWRLTNDTGATITEASLEYTLWIRNDEGQATVISTAYSTDDAGYTTVAALGATTPENSTGTAWTSQRLTAEVTGLNIPDGGSLYLRWSTDDGAGSGGRDEIAFDDITVRMAGCGSGVVEDAEVCDDGNQASGDGCVADCSATEAGWTCAGTAPTVCTDIDECDLGTDACLANSTCDNQPGTYACPCDAGYQGDGLTLCSNIDECATATDDCSDNASCSDTDGSYNCACNEGWAGDGVTCADVDECAEGTDDCGGQNICTNTDGSYTCACEPGFNWDGAGCVDIDECAEDLAGCDENATCQNTAGGFDCECDFGFQGDGLTCEVTDADGDGVDFDDDNCPGDANPGQEDIDGDGRGDACDFDDDRDLDDGGGCGCRSSGAGSTLLGLLLLGLALAPLSCGRGGRGGRRPDRARSPRR